MIDSYKSGYQEGERRARSSHLSALSLRKLLILRSNITNKTNTIYEVGPILSPVRAQRFKTRRARKQKLSSPSEGSSEPALTRTHYADATAVCRSRVVYGEMVGQRVVLYEPWVVRSTGQRRGPQRSSGQHPPVALRRTLLPGDARRLPLRTPIRWRQVRPIHCSIDHVVGSKCWLRCSRMSPERFYAFNVSTR
jgi:hypothetical protein